MSDYDTLAAELEDLREDLQFLKRSTMGLCLPKYAHEHIKSIGQQYHNCLMVPFGAGHSDCFMFNTAGQANGDFNLEIQYVDGRRLWSAVFKDAS